MEDFEKVDTMTLGAAHARQRPKFTAWMAALCATGIPAIASAQQQEPAQGAAPGEPPRQPAPVPEQGAASGANAPTAPAAASPQPAPSSGAPAMTPQTTAETPAAQGTEKTTASDEAAFAAAIAQDQQASGAAPAQQSAAPAAPGANALNPSLSLIGDFAAAYFSDDAPLEAGGHDPTQTGFTLQALELAAGAAVDPYFRFDANLAFRPFEVEIEEAYATTLDLPAGLQARVGQFLWRFGRINPTHLHVWEFVDQPFVISRMFGEDGARNVGIELSLLTPLPWYVELVGSATNADGIRTFFGNRNPGIDGPADLAYMAAVRQFFPLSEDWSLAWGNSAAFGPNPTGRDNRSEIYGTDLYLKFRPITYASYTIVSLQTEWMYRRRQVPAEVLQDVAGYAQLFYRFDQRWATALRYEYGSPAWDRDGNIAPDPLDPEWTDDRHRVSADLTYYPSEFSKLRLQGSGDFPGFRPDPIWAVFLAAEFAIGAHGAHQF